jgi:Rps23 Pro-64 3,4-dihydroxylase Tpa1-like proline 4-hydroxylase
MRPKVMNDKLINQIERINQQSVQNDPFPHFSFDNFLDQDFANEIYDAFPSYEEALKIGHQFKAVNEKFKIQITDSKKFPKPILELHNLLSSDAFVAKVGHMLNIPNLLADPDLQGGGIHETNSGGHLDVHIDFNYVRQKAWHRRVNILIYFNKNWKEEYGGYFDIWDKEVKNRKGYFAPAFNQACGFATGEYSWHGVTPVTCPADMMRRSFAVYYYTKEAPEGWDGVEHSTIFKARPDEWMKGNVAMPVENLVRGTKNSINSLKSGLKSLIK